MANKNVLPRNSVVEFHKFAIKHPAEILLAFLDRPRRSDQFIKVYFVHALGEASYVTVYGARKDILDLTAGCSQNGIVSNVFLAACAETMIECAALPFNLYRLAPDEKSIARYDSNKNELWLNRLYSTDCSMPVPKHNTHMLFFRRQQAESYLKWAILNSKSPKADPTPAVC